MKLSVCIITKNESAKLEHCLEALSVHLNGDHDVVVVDTGSSDDSVEVAARMIGEDHVYHFEWCDDFAAAKNYAISKAAFDEVLVLDTDEYIEVLDHNSIEGFFDKTPDGLGLVCRINHFFYGDENRTFTEWIPRIFSRKIYRYEGRIHEQLVRIEEKRADSPKDERVQLKVVMDHDGYKLDKDSMLKKARRNADLLIAELDELKKIDDKAHIPYVLYQLGKSYYFAGEYAKASEYFGEALGYDLDEHLEYVIDMVSSYGYSLINSGQEEVALGLEGVFETFSHDADYLFVMGLIYMKNALFEKAIDAFLLATGRPAARIAGVNDQLAYYNIGVIYECLGKKSQAVEYYSKCEGYEPAKRQLESLKKTAKSTVVFLPYKSAMWDSLESVYLECAKDPDIDAVVMPIPYISVDQETGKAYVHTDDDFPKDIPITDYRQYDLSKVHPDAIFIHNPYDGANLITSVYPDYYSDKLKKVTDLLVYIPYFASANGISEGMSILPAYKNADWWIVPSPEFKESAAGNPFYDKMLPLGSPKYDRVIRLIQDKVKAPAEWGEVDRNRKILVISSTLNTMLADTESYIKNYAKLFLWLKQRDDISVVWRPHPLFDSTFRTVRAGLYESWCSVVRDIESSGKVITDHTADISTVVAVSDALIDDGSSIASLYMAAGKPVYKAWAFGFEKDSMEAFLDGVTKESLGPQIAEDKAFMSRWATYLDGSCGRHIYEWLKKALKSDRL